VIVLALGVFVFDRIAVEDLGLAGQHNAIAIGLAGTLIAMAVVLAPAIAALKAE